MYKQNDKQRTQVNLEYVVNAPSVDSFKNRLDKQWSNEELVYDYKAAAPTSYRSSIQKK